MRMVKTDSGKPTVRQLREIESLRELGATCYIVNGVAGVANLMLEIRAMVRIANKCPTCAEFQSMVSEDYFCKSCTTEALKQC